MDKKPQLHVSQKFILSALTVVCFALIAVSFFYRQAYCTCTECAFLCDYTVAEGHQWNGTVAYRQGRLLCDD